KEIYIWDLEAKNEKLQKKIEEEREAKKFREQILRDCIKDKQKKYNILY
ncbi:27284_t:CDS:1, partial [Dentiscutata erythropus]